jgi:hypothetical protein
VTSFQSPAWLWDSQWQLPSINARSALMEGADHPRHALLHMYCYISMDNNTDMHLLRRAFAAAWQKNDGDGHHGVYHAYRDAA